MQSGKKDIFWKLLLAAILLLMAASVYVGGEKIDYTWRWERVPDYFLYHAEIVHKTPVDGTVTSISSGVDGTVVSINGDDGSSHRVTVDPEGLKVKEGEYLFEDDYVGTSFSWKVGPLLQGLWVTIWLSFFSGILGMFLGLAAGLCRVSKNYTLRGLAITYIELIRGTPLLVQIFIFYFFIGTVFDLERTVAGIGALGIFAGAYVAEIIRAGIQSIPKGQTEAARSLGMNMFQAMVYIILPQAFKRTLPPLAGQFISLVKDSSLVSVIAITDLTKSGREVITSTFATFEVWFVVAALYLVVTSIMSQLVQYVERRLAISD